MKINDFKKTGPSAIVWSKRGSELTAKRTGKTISVRNKIKIKDDNGK